MVYPEGILALVPENLDGTGIVPENLDVTGIIHDRLYGIPLMLWPALLNISCAVMDSNDKYLTRIFQLIKYTVIAFD
jgi:hypothetical protein